MSSGRRIPPLRGEHRVDPGPAGVRRAVTVIVDLPTWAWGMARTTVEYVLRLARGRAPSRHSEVRHLQAPADLVGEAHRQSGDSSQTVTHGVGPLFHRTYTARINGADCSPEELLERLISDLNSASPTEVARFERTSGTGTAAPGDEWVVRMPGPWDAPVRLIRREDRRFVLATLQGHMEAGSIEFTAEPDGDELVFRIESWARSGDRLFDLLYDKLDLSREMQLHMWVHVAEQTAKLSGGELSGPVDVTTERDPDGGHLDLTAAGLEEQA